VKDEKTPKNLTLPATFDSLSLNGDFKVNLQITFLELPCVYLLAKLPWG